MIKKIIKRLFKNNNLFDNNSTVGFNTYIGGVE